MRRSDIFSQINGVYDKVEDLQFVIKRLKRGADSELQDRLRAEHLQRHGAARDRGVRRERFRTC